MRAIRLRCKYLNNPVGVDFTRPRLMWNVEGGVKQTAYRIVTEHERFKPVERIITPGGKTVLKFPQNLCAR